MSTVKVREPRQWIRTSQVARILGISEQTVRRKATDFKIRVRTLPGLATRLFCLADVMRLQRRLEQSEDQKVKKGTARPR